ncbi:juvenile hormone acid O-methyltransferase-like isoform X3 [Odontomachus brunneus]|uniref:juvenile hormone acid O-methyltransferase-like isoform X3 n=1 Tax=Odontomachus brunneus TaxID=486640 RepID=UPI0013F255F8|nr:juvenile hormone acid O-methyltransferase-like isoform X3 [Odontomachus brunneus]
MPELQPTMIDAKQYSQSNDASQKGIIHIINEFDEQLINISGKCMDIGCGPGDVTRNIILPALHMEATIIGTDISEDMIKYANKLYEDEKRLEFEILDIQTKNLPDKYISEFDHVFSFHTLHWCDDIRQALENIYHILRPGGTFLCAMKFNKFLTPFHNIPQPDKKMKKLLQSIGFVINHCSHRERTIFIKNVQKFPSAILSFVSLFLKDMPYNLLEQFKDEFTREYTRTLFGHAKLYNDEMAALDLHEILVFYAQKITKEDNERCR